MNKSSQPSPKTPPCPFRLLRNTNLNANDMSVAQKKWLGDVLFQKPRKLKKMATDHNLNTNTLSSYKQSARKQLVPHLSGGRPEKLDETSKEYVIETLKIRRASSNIMPQPEFIDLLALEAAKTSVRAGRNDMNTPLSKGCVRSIKRKLNLGVGLPDIKPTCRVTAEADPRNSLSEALLFNAFQTGIDPSLIINIDDTQYFIPYNDFTVTKCVYVLDAENDATKTLPSNSNGAMGFYIKSKTIGSASGHMGPMVLHIADDTLNPEEMRLLTINGLTHTSDITKVGTVVFTKTRSPNVTMLNWYIKYVLCGHVDTIKEALDSPESFAFVSTDGEYGYIQAAMANMNLLEESKILHAKHSASYSAKSNAWDAGNYFKATKKVNSNMRRDEVIRMTSAVRRSLEKAFTDPVNSVLHLPVATRNHYIDGICRLVASCQCTLTPRIVSHGFALTGQYVNDAFNFDTKMRCCTTYIPHDQLQLMRNQFQNLTAIMKENGCVTELEYDNAGIMKVEAIGRSTVPKDAKSLHQNRALMLNSRCNIDKFNAKAVEALITPADKLAIKQAKRKAKDDAKNEAKEAKAAIKKQRKDDVEAAREATRAVVVVVKPKTSKPQPPSKPEGMPNFNSFTNRKGKRGYKGT